MLLNFFLHLGTTLASSLHRCISLRNLQTSSCLIQSSLVFSERTSLLGFLVERLEELLLANGAVVVLVELLEVILELVQVEVFLLWLEHLHHLLGECEDFVFLELPVLVDIDISEEFLCSFLELRLGYGPGHLSRFNYSR